MSPLYPGAASSRADRQSDLLFYWRSAEGRLTARTGHIGTLSHAPPTLVPGALSGVNGSTIGPVGHSQPRFGTSVSRGSVTRLLLEGDVAGQNIDRLSYPFPALVQPMTVWVRVWPGYAPGQNLATAPVLLSLGEITPGGGRLSIGRTGTSWFATRAKDGPANASSTVTEPATATFPIEVLVTLALGGQLRISTRDNSVARIIAQGTLPTPQVAHVSLADTWNPALLHMAIGGNGGMLGGSWHYEAVKVAPGVQTFAQMDALA